MRTELDRLGEERPAGALEMPLRRRHHGAQRRYWLHALGLLGFLGAWWATIRIFAVPPYVAPSPLVVAWTIHDKLGLLMTNLAPTAIEAITGFIIGNFAAIMTAAVFVHSRTAEDLFFPVTVLINTVPLIAKAPILVLLLGMGIEPRIATAALICYFPTLVNMVRGLEAVNPQVLELMHVLSASRWEIFIKLRLFNSLPYLFSALKIATSSAVVGAILGEWIGSRVGIGALIIQAMYAFDSALLYATVIVGSGFSIVFFLLIGLSERLVVRWPAPATH